MQAPQYYYTPFVVNGTIIRTDESGIVTIVDFKHLLPNIHTRLHDELVSKGVVCKDTQVHDHIFASNDVLRITEKTDDEMQEYSQVNFNAELQIVYRITDSKIMLDQVYVNKFNNWE